MVCRLRNVSDYQLDIEIKYQSEIEDLTSVLMFIEFVKRVGEKRSNARLVEHFISFSQLV